MLKNVSQLTLQELFQLGVTSPYNWFAQGAGLLRAAYILWERHKSNFDNIMLRINNKETFSLADLVNRHTNRWGSSYMLLAGLAIENAVKGLIISQKNVPPNQGHIPKECQGHDLGQLFITAGLEIEAEEEHLIEYLTEAILWKGRYHTPLKVNSIKNYLSYGQVICTPNQVRRLFIRVIEAYPKAIWKQISEMLKENLTTASKWLAFINSECPESP